MLCSLSTILWGGIKASTVEIMISAQSVRLRATRTYTSTMGFSTKSMIFAQTVTSHILLLVLATYELYTPCHGCTSSLRQQIHAR